MPWSKYPTTWSRRGWCCKYKGVDWRQTITNYIKVYPIHRVNAEARIVTKTYPRSVDRSLVPSAIFEARSYMNGSVDTGDNGQCTGHTTKTFAGQEKDRPEPIPTGNIVWGTTKPRVVSQTINTGFLGIQKYLTMMVRAATIDKPTAVYQRYDGLGVWGSARQQ